MFYLKKYIHEKQFRIGDRIMVLSDFVDIKAGTKGTVTEIYHKGVMVTWDDFNPPFYDGFSRDELEYLAVETKKHPTKGGAENV